jgi:hypothetical protein
MGLLHKGNRLMLFTETTIAESYQHINTLWANDVSFLNGETASTRGYQCA